MTAVLVVEDEILVRLAICKDLAAEGYKVLTADNADQAIEILQSRNDITTIFTDIEIPGSMNGLKLAAAVRDRWPPVHIVITTGKARPPNDQMPTNSRFIAKPPGLCRAWGVNRLATFRAAPFGHALVIAGTHAC